MIKATYCCIPDLLHPLFNEAVLLYSQHLGIDTYDASIKFHFKPPGYKSEDGRLEGGHMYPSTNKLNSERINKGLPPKEFEVSLTLDNPHKMVLSFTHEMMHVKQWLTGALSAKTLEKTGTAIDHTLYYYNTPVDLHTTKYEVLPWETEVFHKASDEGIWLIRALMKNEHKITRDIEAYVQHLPKSTGVLHRLGVLLGLK